MERGSFKKYLHVYHFLLPPYEDLAAAVASHRLVFLQPWDQAYRENYTLTRRNYLTAQQVQLYCDIKLGVGSGWVRKWILVKI